HSAYALHVGLPGAIVTFGVGMSFVPITLAATSGVDPHDAGLASGLINTTRQVGGSLGLAVLLTIVASREHATRLLGALGAQTSGYTRAFAVDAALMVVAATIALIVLPALRAPEPASVPSPPAETAGADAEVFATD